MVDISFTIAGQAGQGLQSISGTLGRIFARAGYHVFVNQDLMSRIRGGHNFANVRICERPVSAPSGKTNLLIALDELSMTAHKSHLVPNGVAIFDSEQQPQAESGVQLLAVPLTKIAKSVGKSSVMTNAVAMGAVMYLTGYPLDQLVSMFKETFATKGEEVVRANAACAQAGFDHAQKNFKGSCPCQVSLPAQGVRRLLMIGNEALALGAICSGVKFHSGYPMSPSTPIMEFLAAQGPELGIVVEQSEDEIAGINMALGAAYAGVRAMTATSGGGFALMVEGLGLAAIGEIPIVIVICSRPGPATGFPTRTEQADLLFALHASQDEFPRFIFAPGTTEQAFYTMNHAFELSWKYQVPALVLSDQLLSDSSATIDDLDLARMKIGRYDATREWNGREPYSYRRYAAIPNRGPVLPVGVCPLVFPGVENQVVVAGGHEHSEDGYITESAAVRNQMMERRLGKTEPMRAELNGVTCSPNSNDETMLVCFGSTLGAVHEAVDLLRAQGVSISMCHLSELAPLPRGPVTETLEKSRRLLTIENNATAQLAQLIVAETNLHIQDSVLKFDGRPFTGQEIADQVRRKL